MSLADAVSAMSQDSRSLPTRTFQQGMIGIVAPQLFLDEFGVIASRSLGPIYIVKRFFLAWSAVFPSWSGLLEQLREFGIIGIYWSVRRFKGRDLISLRN